MGREAAWEGEGRPWRGVELIAEAWQGTQGTCRPDLGGSPRCQWKTSSVAGIEFSFIIV